MYKNDSISVGERCLHIPSLRIVDSPLCPVSAYLRMIRLVPARRSSAGFLISGPTGLVPLTKRSFVSNFRSCLVAAGISNAQSFKGHSFRRGAASWAFTCGVPGELIQLYGDWSSDVYKLYLEFSLESKLTLANQLRQAIMHAQSHSFSPQFILSGQLVCGRVFFFCGRDFYFFLCSMIYISCLRVWK